MANIASALKEEITRLARKEIRTETERLKIASVQYRTEIAALKRSLVLLEQQLSRLEKTAKKNTPAQTSPDTSTKIRFVAKGFKSLRQRLGLTAAETGILLESSAPTIYNWEAGITSPREPQLIRIAKLRTFGKREVAVILKNQAE